LQVELPLRSLFESPTVSELSQAIEKARGNGLGSIARLSRERYRARASAPRPAAPTEVLRETTDV